jgi:hypothetical protein
VAVFTGGRYAQTSAPAKILGAHVIPALLSAAAFPWKCVDASL